MMYRNRINNNNQQKGCCIYMESKEFSETGIKKIAEAMKKTSEKYGLPTRVKSDKDKSNKK